MSWPQMRPRACTSAPPSLSFPSLTGANTSCLAKAATGAIASSSSPDRKTKRQRFHACANCSHCSADDPLLGLHEPIGEAIGLALDRGIEHLDRMRIVLSREQGAFRV